MIFASRLNRPQTILSPMGDGSAQKYEESFEDGFPHLVPAGKDNLFEYVQASKDECLVSNIIERYKRGDVDVLNRRAGQYMDVVGMPTNLAEAHQVMIDVQRKFDSLDPEVRKNFDNDINVFVDKVSHATGDQLKDLFGVTDKQIESVKDGDGDVA